MHPRGHSGDCNVAQGKVSLSYNSPQYLKERYGLPVNLLPNIAVIETLAAKAAE